MPEISSRESTLSSVMPERFYQASTPAVIPEIFYRESTFLSISGPLAETFRDDPFFVIPEIFNRESTFLSTVDPGLKIAGVTISPRRHA